MTDLLVRGVDSQVLQDLSDGAAKQGISREELIRRELAQCAQRVRTRRTVTVADFERSAYLASDLLDADFVARMHRL